MPKILARFVCTSFSVIALAACDGSGSNSNAVSETGSALSPEALLVVSCSGCHSDHSGAIASLASYDEGMLREALLRYKTEPDASTVMHRLARGYSETEISFIAKQLGQSQEDR